MKSYLCWALLPGLLLGGCVRHTGLCASQDDCDDGQICDLPANRCVPAPGVTVPPADLRTGTSPDLASPWTVVPSGVGSTLTGVWGSDPGDIWVVGSEGTVLRRQANGGFAKQSTGGNGGNLTAIWGSGPGDVWVVGGVGTVLHYTPQGVLPAGPAISDTLLGIWGDGPTDDIWVVGSSGTAEVRFPTFWTNSANDPQMATLYGVWGSSQVDVWIVGAAGSLLHSIDGATAPRINQALTTNDLLGVWGSGPNDLWAVGTQGTILHVKDQTKLSLVPLTQVGATLTAVSGNGRGDVWIVGQKGTVLHGTGPADLAPLPDVPLQVDFNGVWASGPGDAWIVGSGGTILHYRRNSP